MMYNRKEILKYLNSGFSLPNLSLNSIHGLFNMIYSKLNDIFITAIDGLSKDKVISIDKNLYIDKADKGYVIAENEEINKYERLSAELILEMGYSDIYSLMADYNRYLKYKNNLKKSYSNLYGWKNAHYRYCITGLNTSYIEKHFLDDKVSMQEKLYNEVKLFVEERIKKAVEKGKSHYWSVIDNCLETDAELRFDFMLDEWVADDMVFFLYNVA